MHGSTSNNEQREDRSSRLFHEMDPTIGDSLVSLQRRIRRDDSSNQPNSFRDRLSSVQQSLSILIDDDIPLVESFSTKQDWLSAVLEKGLATSTFELNEDPALDSSHTHE